MGVLRLRITNYLKVANCDDNSNMMDRAMRDIPTVREVCLARVMETCSITPSVTRIHFIRCHAGMRCMQIGKHACQFC